MMPSRTTPATSPAPARRGFSIIELLVAVIIIGILVTIIVLRVTDRSEQAKIARAEADLETIQHAQETAVIDISYMLRLHVLDDVRGGDGLGQGVAADRIDGIFDERFNTLHNFNGGQLFIDPNTNDLLGLTAAAAVYGQIETGTNWSGPYLTYQANTATPLSGIGDDPWGRDYLFFTPVGLLDEEPGSPTNGRFVATKTFGGTAFNCVVFDRPTVVSLGPNGVPGDGTLAVTDGFGRGDDIWRSF